MRRKKTSDKPFFFDLYTYECMSDKKYSFFLLSKNKLNFLLIYYCFALYMKEVNIFADIIY